MAIKRIVGRAWTRNSWLSGNSRRCRIWPGLDEVGTTARPRFSTLRRLPQEDDEEQEEEQQQAREAGREKEGEVRVQSLVYNAAMKALIQKRPQPWAHELLKTIAAEEADQQKSSDPTKSDHEPGAYPPTALDEIREQITRAASCSRAGSCWTARGALELLETCRRTREVLWEESLALFSSTLPSWKSELPEASSFNVAAAAANSGSQWELALALLDLSHGLGHARDDPSIQVALSAFQHGQKWRELLRLIGASEGQSVTQHHGSINVALRLFETVGAPAALAGMLPVCRQSLEERVRHQRGVMDLDRLIGYASLPPLPEAMYRRSLLVPWQSRWTIEGRGWAEEKLEKSEQLQAADQQQFTLGLFFGRLDLECRDASVLSGEDGHALDVARSHAIQATLLLGETANGEALLPERPATSTLVARWSAELFGPSWTPLRAAESGVDLDAEHEAAADEKKARKVLPSHPDRKWKIIEPGLVHGHGTGCSRVSELEGSWPKALELLESMRSARIQRDAGTLSAALCYTSDARAWRASLRMLTEAALEGEIGPKMRQAALQKLVGGCNLPEEVVLAAMRGGRRPKSAPRSSLIDDFLGRRRKRKQTEDEMHKEAS